MENESKSMRYETQIQLVPNSMKTLNKQFALVDILLCYHGDNRNRTSMSKEVIETALPSLYGVPIVGEYIYLDDGSQDFGSHGGKIILSDKGIKFEDTTKPYGFITKDAVENAKWVTVTEKDGFTQHEYLELKGCIIWAKRYEEVSSLLDKNYGQSMEIEIQSGRYDENDYYVIEDMTFSAACILGSNPDGTDVEPCFESACIGRHYELDSFKQEFSLMLDEYKKFSSSEPNNHKTNKEEKKFMDLEKLNTFLSTFKLSDDENSSDKYALVGNPTESAFTVLDKEDYKLYSVEFALDDDQNIVADWDGKTEKKFSVVDAETENALFIGDVIDFNKVVAEKVDARAVEINNSFKAEIEKLGNDYKLLEDKLGVAETKVAEYEAKEAKAQKEAHIAEVNGIVTEFSKKLGRNAKFLIYKAKLDAEHASVDEVTKDLTLMVGQEMVDGKANFSYQPQETKVTSKENNEVQSRYGNLLNNYIK